MENQVIDFGVNKVGTHKKVIIEDGTAVEKTTFDVAPLLQEAAQLRSDLEGKRWGEGRVVGKIPQSVLNHINQNIHNATERQLYVMNWLKSNPAFITYKPYFEKKSASFLT
jgi:hypothetical protein